MATKATGSGRAPSLETWDPNIKAPGIQQRTGAYFSGKVAELPDYADVNEKIQTSLSDAMEIAGKAYRMNQVEENPLLKENGLNSDGESAKKVDMTIGKISSNATTNTTAQLEDIIPNIVAENSDDRRYARFNKKGKTVTFKDLKKQDKIEANKRASEISEYNGLIKSHIEVGWQSSKASEIDWGNWDNHKNAQSFMTHLIEGDAKYRYEKDPTSGKTVIAWGDGPNKKTITKTELAVAQDMWASNVDGVSSYEDRYKKDGELLKKDFGEFQDLKARGTIAEGQIDATISDRIVTAINDNYDSQDKEYIWNNVIRNRMPEMRTVSWNEGTTMVVDPVTQEEITQEQFVNSYLDEKLREYAGYPPRTKIKEDLPGNNIGAGNISYNGNIYNRDEFNRVERSILPVFQNFAQQPSIVDYTAENPVPNMDNYSEMVSKIKGRGEEGADQPDKTSIDLRNTIEGKRSWWSKTFDSADDVLNDVINKENRRLKDPDAGIELTADEKDILTAYKNFKGVMDNKVELDDSIFDPMVKATNPIFDKINKVMKVDIDGVEKSYDLTDPTQFSNLAALLLKRTGFKIGKGEEILMDLLGDTKFEVYKPAL